MGAELRMIERRAGGVQGIDPVGERGCEIDWNHSSKVLGEETRILENPSSFARSRDEE